MGKNNVTIHRPKTKEDFQKLHNNLLSRGYVALDALKPGPVRSLTLGEQDPSINKASDLASCIGTGAWSNGPLSKVAWSFDERTNTVVSVNDKDGKPMGLGYVKWGPGNCTPSTIPVLAQALPYTAAPLRYIADLIAGLGPRLMYRFPDGTLTEFKDAGDILLEKLEELEKEKPQEDPLDLTALQPDDASVKKDSALKRAREAYEEWKKTWFGYEEKDDLAITTHIPGAKEFLEENNLNLHLSQCMQDNVMLDIYFPTVGFNTRGTRKNWRPRVTRIGFIEAPIVRIEKRNEFNYSNHVYVSEQWRTLGATTTQVVTADSGKTAMYPAVMPQRMLHDLRYIVESGQKSRIKDRPMWVVCPTFYPSLNKPYYPQPAWWSIFTSKAYDFSSTILYDKAKQRENRTSWGRVLYLSLDYLEQVFSDEGFAGNKDKQQEFIDGLEASMEDFLQHRENQGKFMRQWMWLGPDGKEHKNVEIVDIKDAVGDEVKAGKDELELSTSPIFLALQVDPRLVGVPMVAASNGGTALREMHLLKQQQLSVHQRLYLNWLQSVTVNFNHWDPHAQWVIAQQTLTTLDRSSTGLVDTISDLGQGA